jgi:hypothetical protein
MSQSDNIYDNSAIQDIYIYDSNIAGELYDDLEKKLNYDLGDILDLILRDDLYTELIDELHDEITEVIILAYE